MPEAVCGVLLAGLISASQAGAPDPREILGTWRGTSTCTDRQAAPACRDEVIVYEMTRAKAAGQVRWKADKIVNGTREPMGELVLAYDESESCWWGEFASPRVRSVWCLAVDGDHLTGTARLLPSKVIVRKVDARRAPAAR